MSIAPTDPTTSTTSSTTSSTPTPDPRPVLGVQINTLDLGLGIAVATVVLEDGTIQTAQWPVTLVTVDRTFPLTEPTEPGPDTGSTP